MLLILISWPSLKLAVPIFLPLVLEARIALNIVFDFLLLHFGLVFFFFGFLLFSCQYPSSLEVVMIDGVPHFCWVRPESLHSAAVFF